MIVLILLSAVVVIWVNWLIAKQFANAAEEKGYYEMRYFWICFLMGIVGYLLVIALPDRGKKTSNGLPPLNSLPPL